METEPVEANRPCSNPTCETAVPPESHPQAKYCTPVCKRRAQYDRLNIRDYEYGRLLKKRYGIEPSTYRGLVEQQGGRCAICGEEPQGVSRLHVDHDHESGAVRALLCRACNHALGNVQDRPDRLRAMIEYLAKYGRT